jgi:tetratricopeptide (TPR) repeat protein
MRLRKSSKLFLLFVGSGFVAAGMLAVLRFNDRPEPWMTYRYPAAAGVVSLEFDSDPDREIRFYEARMAAHPESALELADLAGAYREKAKRDGDPEWFEKARQTAEKSLQLLPHFNLGAKRILANLAQDRHDFATALSLANEILQEKPSHTEALSLIVTGDLGLGKVPQALAAADQLVRRIPGIGSFALRALVHWEAGREAEALVDFKRAILSEDYGDPESSAWVRTLLGRCHLKKGRLQTARFLFQEALRIRRDYPLAMGLLAEVEVQTGNLPLGEKLYRRAFELSREPSYRVDLGAALAAADRREEAELLWREAEAQMREDLKSNPYGHRGELVHLLLNRGRREDFPEAVALAEAEAKGRHNRETMETLAWARRMSRPF